MKNWQQPISSPSSPWPQNNAFPPRCVKGQEHGQMRQEVLFPVRTVRLQFFCKTLLSLEWMFPIWQMQCSWEIPKLALKELFPETGAACGLIGAMEGESRAGPMLGCAVQVLSVPGKRPRCWLQAQHRALGGKADTAHLLLAANGPWLLERALWAHRCLVKGSVQSESGNYWRRNGIWILVTFLQSGWRSTCGYTGPRQPLGWVIIW